MNQPLLSSGLITDLGVELDELLTIPEAGEVFAKIEGGDEPSYSTMMRRVLVQRWPAVPTAPTISPVCRRCSTNRIRATVTAARIWPTPGPRCPPIPPRCWACSRSRSRVPCDGPPQPGSPRSSSSRRHGWTMQLTHTSDWPASRVFENDDDSNAFDIDMAEVAGRPVLCFYRNSMDSTHDDLYYAVLLD